MMTKWTIRYAATMALTVVMWPVLGQELQPGGEQPIDAALAAEYFQHAKALSDADGGALWGTKLYGPMLLVDPQTRFVVANVPDRGRVLKSRSGVFVGTLPAEVNIANTTTSWSGVQWSMVMWPLPGNEAERGTLMMHESFHRIQVGLGLALAVRNNSHLDSADGRIWLRLEWRALAEALVEDDPLASEALKDALMFRGYRRKLSPKARTEERDIELSEGLAEYTGVTLGGYDAEAGRQRTINQLRGYDRMAHLSRSFAYASGPPYGLLLDLANPDWRTTISQSTDLGVELRRAMNFPLPRNLKELALDRAKTYDGDALIEEETEREQERVIRQQEYQAVFIHAATLRIPAKGNIQFTFDPHGVESLDGFGSIYRSMRISGPWGILDSTGPILWVTEVESFKHFRVPAPVEFDPSNPVIRGQGWELTLNRGWRARRTSRKGDFILESR